MYALKLLNKTEQNYSTTQKKALAMVFSLHKFKHYFLGNKFVFFVNHMALAYLVNKPQVYDYPVISIVLDQTTYASLSYTWPKWLNDVKEFKQTRQIEGTLSV
jgi:hypothetical protein